MIDYNEALKHIYSTHPYINFRPVILLAFK